jgi:hypothetical protein
MNTTILQAQEVFQRRPHAGVGQDNKPPRRLTAASAQPVTAESQAVNDTIAPITVIPTADNRPTHHGSETRQLELIAGRVPPHIKSEVNRLAELRGETESKTVRHLVEQALARTIAEQFGVMIRQTIQEAVRQEFQKFSDRWGTLNFSVYCAAEQGRVMQAKELYSKLNAKDVRKFPEMIRGFRQEALDNLKFYKYSLKDIEAMIDETVPWQSSR